MKSLRIYQNTTLVSPQLQEKEVVFRRLYDDYSGAIYGVILSLIDDTHLAEEVLQDTFLKIWKNMDQYDPKKGTWFTWMHHIARNTALDVMRSKAFRNRSKNEPLSDHHMQLPAPAAQEDTGLRKLAGQLKDDHSVLIELAYFQGYTQEEIGRKLNIPLGTVKTRLRTALKRLAKMITDP
ncbi:RNA polymerase sigma factor [Chitinophaga sp. HK235]|uniref:RNA polymerase sigma factor n=1 Tax=Chitinophaga sp. HK235 TaxID=2952571 RepID=UPI001BAB58D6|nr:RNA polymerase sigma factor [Chitinophaga sp. HK235]